MGVVPKSKEKHFIENKQTKYLSKTKFVDTKNRLVVPEAGGGWWVKLKRVVERYKLAVNKV